MLEIERLAGELEPVVDRHGIGEVLKALALLCGAKSAHVEAEWQDRALARSWLRVGEKIGLAARAAASERL